MKWSGALISFLLLSVLTGCTTVGTGHRTVVRASCADFGLRESGSAETKEQQRLCDDLAKRYPHLIAGTLSDGVQANRGEENGEERILRIDPEGRPLDPNRTRPTTPKQPSYQQFQMFLEHKYGSKDFKPVELSFLAHERTVTPPFLSVDPRPTWSAALTTLLLNTDKDLSTTRRLELQDLLEARLRNIADLGPATAPHHTTTCGKGCRPDFDRCVRDCRNETQPSGVSLTELDCQDSCSVAARVYYYYPRVSVDFSSSFLSTTTSDRLSYMALIVRLRENPAGGSNDNVRFIDFRPKDADIIEFSRGDLTQGLTLTAGANVGATGGGSLTLTEAPKTNVTTTGSSSGANVGATLSETLASKLADSIEKKTTGILEDGRTFFADFRSLRQIRVAGTYNFDLMMEVPSRPHRPVQSEVAADHVESLPIQGEIKADVYLLGVVRHVHDRGRIGFVNRVPESENDHVFEQVVLRVLPEQTLWIAPQEHHIDSIVTRGPECKLQVLTNREEAGFVVKGENREILASGTGRKADLSFPQTQETCGTATVTFFPVILTTEGKTVVLEAESRKVQIGTSQQIVEGTYRPEN
jgi:hypothetical protein